MDGLGHLLAPFVGPASEQQERAARAGGLAEAVQEATGESVELAYVDRGYTGEGAAEEADAVGLRLEVVKREEAKRGFVLLPRRRVVERDFSHGRRACGAWPRTTYRLADTLAGLHSVAFGCLFLQQATGILGAGP